MDLAGLLQLLRRQWILVGVIMLVAGTSAYLTWTQATPTYRANATMSVLPPRVNVEGVPRNPYLEIASASNADIAQRLSIQLNGTEWRDRLEAEGFSPDYLVDHGDATSPVLRLNIETDEPEFSEATLLAVMDGLTEQLATQQERFDINQRSRFTIDLLDRSSGATRVYGNRTRLTGAILVLGGIAAVVAAQGLDNLQRRRRSNRLAATPAAADPAAAEPTGQRGAERADQERAGLWIPRPNVEGRPLVGATSAQAPPPSQTAPRATPPARGQTSGDSPSEPAASKWTRSAGSGPRQDEASPNTQQISETSRLVVKGSPAAVTGEIPSRRRRSPKPRERE